MPTIVGILTFISRINLMLICVEHEKKFITSRPGQFQYDRITNIHNMSEELLQANLIKTNYNFVEYKIYFKSHIFTKKFNKLFLSQVKYNYYRLGSQGTKLVGYPASIHYPGSQSRQTVMEAGYQTRD